LDILIKGGTLLTMEAGAEALGDPLIGIRDGRIAFVGDSSRPPGGSLQAEEELDATGCLILPGLVNAHTHLAMTLFRGLADDLPLMTWLNDHIFPAEGQHINADTVYAGSLLAMAEMLLSGTTTFCDGYFHEGAVARAALAAGMRGVVAQGFIDFRPRTNPGQAERGPRRGLSCPLAAALPPGHASPGLPLPLHLLPGHPPGSEGRGPTP
jgi:5-methylthioadenosine/S-adenosylhomocysteine deaminase